MTEETLFAAALEKRTPAERATFLDVECAGDEALRRRVEALLGSHERTDFLKTPAIEQAAQALGGVPTVGASPTEPGNDADTEPTLDFLTPSQKPDSLGRFAHYEVDEVLGQGGMGVVLRAFDERLHRVVAIKVLAPHLATSAAGRRRFTREAQAAAAVSHDHVVTIFAVEETASPPYLVMQCVSGVSLQERIDRDGPLQLLEILRIGMQTASGLAAAHAQGLIHRDIKPANILLENGVERVKITDFGLARAVDDASLTQSGVVAGTPNYMAPEQARGEAIDQRADLFSLGSVLYAMCTGRAPFRASGTMAVLKRVCEETPGPIREVNPEIPDWLAAIIAKLHAKAPADRYQSAAEVAEVLGRHLAHVQHPSVVPMPPAVRTGRAQPPRRRWRWAAVAAVLLCLIGGLGLSEATGVTQFTATVIRILTPDGTLVVEANDPAVKVTVEGDGDLVITGAGAQEVRLRPGSYKLSATKDGKPVRLDRDLVTITRNDKQVVKVRLEEGSDTAAPNQERAAFVTLGGKGVAERKFHTLAQAIAIALDGDTIEVRGNGPFFSKPIVIGQSLTIRAGQGFLPVIRLAGGEPGDDWLITAHAPLVLEGLDIREVSRARSQPPVNGRCILYSDGKSLHLANCRVSQEHPIQESIALMHAQTTVITLRNCGFYSSPGNVVGVGTHLPLRLTMDNCLVLGYGAIYLNHSSASMDAIVEMNRNTLVTSCAGEIGFSVAPDPVAAGVEKKRLRVVTNSNVFDVRKGMFVLDASLGGSVLAKWATANDAETIFKPLTDWREARNVYVHGATSVHRRPGDEGEQPIAPRNKQEWERFWNITASDSLEGAVRLQGGDLLARAFNSPDDITPDDFRLRPDSAGYRAGPDGKDLGADVDLVGPGPAYERWKKTPEYQEWLIESGQLFAEAPRPEPGAFVVLGGKGVPEEEFDTLAEAVMCASDGDTIEVRGNGPFVSEPIRVHNQRLTVRAADGYRPVIRLSKTGTDARKSLLRSNSSLVLEGLEFQYVGPSAPNAEKTAPIVVAGEGERQALHITNCRFRLDADPWAVCIHSYWPPRAIVVRNCEFYCPQGYGVSTELRHEGIGQAEPRRVMDNCIYVGGEAPNFLVHLGQQVGEKVELTRNTVVSTRAAMQLYIANSIPDGGAVVPPSQIRASHNIFDAPAGLYVYQPEEVQRADGEASGPEDVGSLARRLVAWVDRENVYQVGGCTFKWGEFSRLAFPSCPKNPDEWKQFWGTPEGTCQESQFRYQGGSLHDQLATAPDKLSPEDFRLRPDSAGYRAGPDGKDLGADVDLVGPGPAYERWKKTPEYQKWLEETRLMK